MTSERVQRQIDRLLDEAEAAITDLNWLVVRDRATAVLALDQDNADARTYLTSAEKALASVDDIQASATPRQAQAATTLSTSFANGRYEVKRYLGEGGRKKVYLAYDTLLDREVAFALIKTEGLDPSTSSGQAAIERVKREAQATGRLGDHPNIVTVFDIGEEPMPGVSTLMPGVSTPGAPSRA